MSYPGGEHDPYSGQPVPHYYGGGSTYQGLGAFDQPPRRPRTPLIIGVVTAIVLVAGGVGVYFLATGGEDEPQNVATESSTSAPPSTTSQSPITSTESSPPPDDPPSGGESSNLKPVVAGWKAVFSAREGAAFDVSKNWTVEPPDALAGFEDKTGLRVVMHGIATYRDGFCSGKPNSNRGRAGFMTAKDLDPAKITATAAKLWATAAMELPEDSPKVKPTPIRTITTHDGKQAWTSTATAKASTGDKCSSDEVKVTAVAFKPHAEGDTALFILYHDTGVKDELPADEAKKIIDSLRAVGGD
ncbi:hypothetical protein [Thermocrispum municipale]|jgi:hypothetical protein|uniref:hypothetical protein n=1 Tax=Thermocrispum municipale TaxID=37926 RepID=UPI0003FAE7F4|nr:hypothetical protein [Thermocrispum municipale]